MRKSLLGLSRSTRNVTRREMLAVGAAAFGGALVPGAARAQQGDQLQTLLRDARAAMQDWRWRDALALFNRAFDFGGQLFASADWADAGETLMRMHYHEDAVAAQHRAYALEEAPWRAFGLVLAYLRLGDVSGARTCWRQIADAHPEFLDDVGFARQREWVSFCTYEFSVGLDHSRWPDDVQERLSTEGSVPWVIPRSDACQQVAPTLVEATRVADVTDRVGNHVWRIAPDSIARAATLRLTVKTTPYDCTGLTCLDDVRYSVPDDYQPYTGITHTVLLPNRNAIDPTTELASKTAAELQGPSLFETVENDLRFAMVDISPPATPLPPEVAGSEGCLRTRSGACEDMAEVVCALLRAQGLAARVCRGMVGFHEFSKAQGEHPLTHSWAQLWVPALGQWTPIVWGARSGSYLHDWLWSYVEPYENSLFVAGLGVDIPPDLHWLKNAADWSYQPDWLLENRLTRISFDDYHFDPESIPETAEE